MESFTEQEKKILEPFVSSTEKDVFVLTNLPEVLKGALFSRYSRSSKSLRRLLLDEFMGEIKATTQTKNGEELKAAIQKAQSFYERILDGFGDDSVGELGGAHLACEYVSNIAAKFLENSRVGGSPLEKSTRYVWFNTKANGEFLFYKEPKIMKSRHANTYLAINRLLFETYSKLIEPMSAFMTENYPIQEFEFFDGKKSTLFPEISDEKIKKMATLAYNASVRAKTCDVLRGLLPASTLTNVGIFGNGRFFQNMLTKMYTSNLSEIRGLGSSIHEELNSAIPSFVRRAKIDEYSETVKKDMVSISKEILGKEEADNSDDVELVHHDKETEMHAIATMLYPYSEIPMKQIIGWLKNADITEIKAIIDSYMGQRRNRRDKPGRALEHIYYTFDILCDFGIYRDLQRHRIMTQDRQNLTVAHGFVIPDEIIQAGFKNDFEYCMEKAKDAFYQIQEDMPDEAQYVVPMACKVRWYAKLNLREAFHLIELRTSPQGHSGYRKVAQSMLKKIEAVHPALSYYMKFADMKSYSLGRLSSEMRKNVKQVN